MFDRDQTSYNKIQQDTTRYNKVARRVQHFVQHETIFLQKYIQQSTTKLDGVAKRVRLHTSSRKTKNVVSYYICLVKSFIAIKLHTTKYNMIQQGGQTSATFRTTWNNISSKIYTTEYNKVWGGQTSKTSYNIPENKKVVSYNICSVRKFDRDQTSYNKIQHDTTRWPNECNISRNMVQHFLKNICNKVGWGGQTNVVSYNICLAKKFDRDQTSYNKIQQGGQTSATFRARWYNIS